jgi:PAS domain S-box-containing protein
MDRHQPDFLKSRAQRWMRVGSVLISFAAVSLFASAFGAHFYSSTVFFILLALVLVALCIAMVLHARSLFSVRSEHLETVNLLDAAEKKYKSLFDNTLDAILILDDEGVCLEGNAAALSLFGAARAELVGASIGEFLAGAEDFQQAWNGFLDRRREHRETRILRSSGEMIFVEYTARADFLPGRHVAVFRDVSQRKKAELALRESEERFQEMARNIEEIFWTLDAENLKVLYVSPAYEAITGRSCESLRENPKSYEEVIHPEDRVRVLSRLGEAVQTGQFDEEFRITKADRATRWVWVRGFPVRDSGGVVRRLVGTAQDVSARKSAEEEIARNLDRAESAGAEADAFRKATLALTQNLSMDYVLDTLLQSLLKLVPCNSARILLVEAHTRLFLAREVQGCETSRRIPKSPATFDAKDSEFLMRVLASMSSLLIPNTTLEAGWAAFKGFSHLRSWLCVPLVASQQVLGLLSLGDTHAQAFSQEHLRLAKSLAIPAAVAIQNARLYEQAEIFRAELEQRLADLEQAQKELREVRHSREVSEPPWS